MGPKKKSNYISGEGFRGNDDLSLNDFKKIAVEGFTADHLTAHTENWTGGIAGLVGLELSNDNKRVTNGKLFLIGSLCRNKKVSANKFWELPEQISLTFTINDCGMFTFPNGGCVSEIIDGSCIPHSFHKGEVLLSKEELPETILGFALKCYIIPTRDTYAKLALLLFPLPKDMLLNTHPLCTNPSFPGMPLFTGEFPLIPSSLGPPLDKNWGFPFTPAIIPGSAYEDSGNFPNTPSVKAAVAAILRKAVKPDSKLSFQTLIPRWKEISEHGVSKLKDSPLELVWPPPSGKNLLIAEGSYSSV